MLRSALRSQSAVIVQAELVYLLVPLLVSMAVGLREFKYLGDDRSKL